ncbi:hypothetical protein EJB05_53296, partial [Eragrostis curvula]
MNARLLHHLAVFLLLTQFTHSTLVPKNKNHPKLKPHASNTYIVHANHLAKPPNFASLDHWYHSLVAAHSPRAAANTSGRILYTYDTVMHGFAVQLTGDEARRMSTAPGVTGVHNDREFKFLTTRSPGFLGLDTDFGVWPETDFGDGVIIGFVDTGIWPESPSFNDRGLGPVRPSWRGGCVDAMYFNASLCNKIVGAKAFDADAVAMGSAFVSPRDFLGHGTHVSSTAAGSDVRDAGIGIFARGTARGVAPKARIAMYMVNDTAPSGAANVAAAIDAAVKDGVDIISLSLGFHQAPFHDDPLAIAAFGAERKGVFVVLAGGNDGPNASSVVNVAPWMTTVGASTIDRMFPAMLRLGDGVVITGQSLYTRKANGSMTPLVPISCRQREELTPDRIMGKIVVCTDGGSAETLIRDAGGAGMVAVDNRTSSLGGLDAKHMEFSFPGMVLSNTDGEKVNSYLASSPYPVASMVFTCETAIGENRAPMVAWFSSRGPNPIVPEILKPDLVAPGLNIFAAWQSEYETRSGTSMACPHVAGAAALIKKKHGEWTPAMIRSALITTAGTLDNTDRGILDSAVIAGRRGATAATPFAVGAGHVRPQLAMDPGLVYDAGERDYVDFLCALNYSAKQIRLFAPDFVKCTRTLPGGVAGLNYPSFVVAFDNGTDVRTLTRTVTAVSEKAEAYNVTVVAPERVKVTVTPATLEFTKPNEKKSYTVEFRSLAGGNATGGPGWGFGSISWDNEAHRVRSPVAFQWKN